MVAPSTPVVFSNVLAHLGTSADDVADKLRARGIQGVRNTGRFLNPIVRYLIARQLLPHANFDLTSGDTLRFVSPLSGLDREVALPAPVLQFLDAFNRGLYPDLELPLAPP